MANGVVYVVGGGMRRSVAALDAATGALLWVHHEDEGLRAEFAPRVGCRAGRVLLDRRPRRTNHLRHDRLPDEGAQREDGAADPDVRRERRHRSEEGLRPGSEPLRAPGFRRAHDGRHRPARLAGDRQGHHRRRRRRPRGHDAVSARRSEGLRARLRRAHRQAALDVPHDPAEGRVRLRHVAERIGRADGPRRRVDADGRSTRNSGMVYLPVETPTNDYYGGHRSGQQPVRREPRRARPARPGSASGTSRSCITRSGTSTSRRRRSWPTSR